jgi:hypothetical protein
MDEVLPDGWREKVEDAFTQGNQWPIYKHVTSRDSHGMPRIYQHYFKIHPRKGFFWKYPIHEILEHAPELSFNRKLIDLEVDHLKDEMKSRKSYLGLLEMAVQEEPNDWRMNHYLNREYFLQSRLGSRASNCIQMRGTRWWMGCGRASTYMWASEAAHLLEMPPLAEEWARKASEAAGHFYEAWHWRAHIAHLHGKWEDCLSFARRRLTLQRQDHHLVKPAVWEWWGYDLIALASHRLGFDSDAIFYGQIAAKQMPDIDRLQTNLLVYHKSYSENSNSIPLGNSYGTEDLISLITPTRNREDFLKDQYERLLSQTHVNWEWLILDDSAEQSSFGKACKDTRIKYFHTGDNNVLSIGEKRNKLIEQARGDWIAHIDDDDIYGGNYLSILSEYVNVKGADLTYLRSWYFIDENGHAGYYSSSAVLPKIEGWGFTYFYRKRIWDEIKFQNHNWEDHFWFQEVINRFSYSGFDDHQGLVLKKVHTENTSNFPWNLTRKIDNTELQILSQGFGEVLSQN